MTVSGIAGAAVLPTLAARFGRRRRLLVVIGLGNTIAVPAFWVVRDPHLLVAISAIMGFLLMAGMPTAFDWSEVLVGRDHAGAVAGFLMVVGNLGGTAYTVVVQVLLFDPMLAVAALTLLAAPWPLLARAHRPVPLGPTTEGAVA
jgi:nitrate/nitrite transporter NarK